MGERQRRRRTEALVLAASLAFAGASSLGGHAAPASKGAPASLLAPDYDRPDAWLAFPGGNGAWVADAFMVSPGGCKTWGLPYEPRGGRGLGPRRRSRRKPERAMSVPGLSSRGEALRAGSHIWPEVWPDGMHNPERP